MVTLLAIDCYSGPDFGIKSALQRHPAEDLMPPDERLGVARPDAAVQAVVGIGGGAAGVEVPVSRPAASCANVVRRPSTVADDLEPAASYA